MLSVVWVSGKRGLHDVYGFGFQARRHPHDACGLGFKQGAVSMMSMA
jgi:hypothetical protein